MMRDGIYVCADGTELDVAFLSETQIVEYGGMKQAQKILGVDNLAHPEVYYDMTRGLYPWFAEVGHA